MRQVHTVGAREKHDPQRVPMREGSERGRRRRKGAAEAMMADDFPKGSSQEYPSTAQDRGCRPECRQSPCSACRPWLVGLGWVRLRRQDGQGQREGDWARPRPPSHRLLGTRNAHREQRAAGSAAGGDGSCPASPPSFCAPTDRRSRDCAAAATARTAPIPKMSPASTEQVPSIKALGCGR